ncbi:2-phosphoxylose phosphatase 1 [Amphibalanus amphitrite]|uniref:2-phosphoxylose phosphatase 1 n=1 Tax=Amphibalanus amphitrite TaxID=1232801 RepID=A0A6A4WA36_AMPAM|nr:2-phosphoxylose phosphatase 1 [Amphibalanus amphitrite]
MKIIKLLCLKQSCILFLLVLIVYAGQAPEGFRLRAALLLVRHGDRGPLLPVRNLSGIDCGVPPVLPAGLRSVYAGYGRAASRAAAGWRARLEAVGGTGALLPADGRCRQGRLTPRGVLQLLRLGAALRPRYAPLLAGVAPQRLTVYYSPTERTLQSGAALAFALAGEKSLGGAVWQATRNVDLCVTQCSCPAARQLYTRAGLAVRRRQADHPAFGELVSRLGPLAVEQPPEAPPLRPAELWDALLASACHQAPLPCLGESCVSAADAGSLLVFRQWEARQPRSQELRSAARLRMRRFFEEAGRQLSRVVSGDRTAPLLTVWAGHDLTLSAALLALGVRALSAQFQPPYASRLAIEVYEPTPANPQRLWQFRLLYNGEDVTPLVPMCAGAPSGRLDLCPLQTLLDFTGPGYMAPFGGRSYEQVCADTNL